MVITHSAKPKSMRFIARRHGVTSSVISSGGSSETLCESIASKSRSFMAFHSCSLMRFTSQHLAQALLQAVQPALDRTLGKAELGRYLRRGL